MSSPAVLSPIPAPAYWEESDMLLLGGTLMLAVVDREADTVHYEAPDGSKWNPSNREINDARDMGLLVPVIGYTPGIAPWEVIHQATRQIKWMTGERLIIRWDNGEFDSTSTEFNPFGAEWTEVARVDREGTVRFTEVPA